MNLYKVKILDKVDGMDDNEYYCPTNYSYAQLYSNLEREQIEYYEICGCNEENIFYYFHLDLEDLGIISEEELETLKKFKVLS